MPSLFRRVLLIVLLCAAGAAAARWWMGANRERRPFDIVIVVGDCLRADRLGAGAEGSRTPFLDQLAKKGTRFTHAYAASSWTVPSIASLFTSRYPSQHGVNTYDAGLRPDEVTLNERLHDAGYFQLGFTANLRLDEAHGFSQGYTAWHVVRHARGETGVKRRGPVMVENAIQLVDSVVLPKWAGQSQRPPFLFYFHFMEAHAPYQPPDEMMPPGSDPERARRVNDALVGLRWKELDDADVATLAALYDGEVTALDAAVRGLFAALEERGLLGNALVIVTADHGEEFREHHQLGHGSDLYDELLHVPLLVSGPGVVEGSTVDTPMSLLDVAPTILDLLGLAPEPRFVGRSRAAWLHGESGPGDDVVAELLPNGSLFVLAPHRGVLIRGSRKVIAERRAKGEVRVDEAYDLARDPGEQHPLAPQPELAAALEQRLASFAGEALPPERRPFDEATRQRLRALGYLVDETPSGAPAAP